MATQYSYLGTTLWRDFQKDAEQFAFPHNRLNSRLIPPASMIYDVASQRFAELVHVGDSRCGPKGGAGGGSKGGGMLKAKGSDGKYQGE